MLFAPGALGLTLVLFFGLSVVVYGAALPSGLFVPCLTIGALGGRLVGEMLHTSAAMEHGELAAGATLQTGAMTAASVYADAGFYALIGAASMLAGVTRMTISLTVILCKHSTPAGQPTEPSPRS